MSGGFGIDRLARRLGQKADARLASASASSVVDWPEVPAPMEFAYACGMEPDPWQQGVLESSSRKIILCCCRQAGKTEVTCVRALRESMAEPGALTLILSPTDRQSGLWFHRFVRLYRSADLDLPGVANETLRTMEFENGSRVVALPANEAGIRGYSAATLVVIDEAARVRDDLIAAIRPTLATTNGSMIALSTPQGRRGWFWDNWSNGLGWERTEIKVKDCPRISEEFAADERRTLGEWMYMQEYECAFLDSETSVFSSDLIARALADDSVLPLFPVARPQEAA